MYALLLTIHVLLCLFLIVVILLQAGKGASMGAAFGGGSQTVFGPRGGQTLLSKTTAIAAVLFMVSSMLLAYLSSRTETAIPVEYQKRTPAAVTETVTVPAEEEAADEGEATGAAAEAEGGATAVDNTAQSSTDDTVDEDAADQEEL